MKNTRIGSLTINIIYHECIPAMQLLSSLLLMCGTILSGGKPGEVSITDAEND